MSNFYILVKLLIANAMNLTLNRTVKKLEKKVRQLEEKVRQFEAANELSSDIDEVIANQEKLQELVETPSNYVSQDDLQDETCTFSVVYNHRYPNGSCDNDCPFQGNPENDPDTEYKFYRKSFDGKMSLYNIVCQGICNNGTCQGTYNGDTFSTFVYVSNEEGNYCYNKTYEDCVKFRNMYNFELEEGEILTIKQYHEVD